MWMYTLFPKVFNMSLTAGIVIVFVLLVRLMLKKAPKIFSYALWAVVLFRLVCPVSFSSPLSLIGLFQAPASAASGGVYSSIDYIPSDIVHTEYPQVNLPLPGVSEAINSSLPYGAEQLAADPLEGLMAAATLLWLSGIAAMLIYSAVSLIRLRRKLVGAVRLRGNIYFADHIASPFVIGVIRPKIYLPSTLPEEEQSHVVLHEQTHIRRLDHIIKMLAFIALAVHWFNPLVWAAFVFAVKDMEMSCDERVLKQMGGEIRGAYGASLLSLATGRRLINGSPLAFGEGNIKARIKNIMNFKKPAAWVIAVSVLAVIIAIVCLLANPHEKQISSDAPPETSVEEVTVNAMVAFVDETLSETEARALQSGIEQIPNVITADFVTREEAFNSFEAEYADASVFEGLDPGVLRHRYYVYIRDMSLAGQTANDILNIAGIATVTMAQTNPTSDETPQSASTAAVEPLIFASGETDLLMLGTLAFNTYMDYRMSEKTPVGERIASCKLNDISVLAGDIKEFCVALNYDITTDNDNYLNPSLGAQGKGTWTDNYMEIRVKYAYDDVYSIKGIRTGGGAQGLAPDAAEPSGTGEVIARADEDGKDENIYPDKSQMLYNAYTSAHSDRFSPEEIRDAMVSVIIKFRDFEGCELIDLWYDEEKSNHQIESYMAGGHGSVNGVSKDNVIVLYSDFTVDSSGGDGSLNPNSTYANWCWILIRDSGEGEWRVDDWGY